MHACLLEEQTYVTQNFKGRPKEHTLRGLLASAGQCPLPPPCFAPFLLLLLWAPTHTTQHDVPFHGAKLPSISGLSVLKAKQAEHSDLAAQGKTKAESDKATVLQVAPDLRGERSAQEVQCMLGGGRIAWCPPLGFSL